MMAPIIRSEVTASTVRLPSAWNSQDSKQTLLYVYDHGLKIAYHGSGKADSDAGAIRSDNPAPESAHLYYFEVTIISKGRDGYIGVGLSAQQASLNKLPGFERNSFGYHADDGNAFNGRCACSSSHEGTSYGPVFGTNDVIGCLLNQMDHTISYTKNGTNLGVAFRNVKGLVLYPTVGLRTPGEKVEANFGAKPFVFNLEGFQQELNMKTIVSIDAIGIPDQNSCLHSLERNFQKALTFLTSSWPECAHIDERNFQKALTFLTSSWPECAHIDVLSYLVHFGYNETAMAMLRESALEEKALSQKNGESMLQRKRIRDAVLAGEIDEAIEQTNLIAPELFMSQPSVLFELKCQKFVEMVRNGDDEATMAYGRTELCDFETESEDNKLHLQEVFSLLAYPHPENSPLGYLFEASRRQCVAEALNEAILVSQNKPSLPPLEVLHKHVAVIRDVLAQQSSGATTMIDMYTDVHGLQHMRNNTHSRTGN